jgi:hypothetical protein
MSTSAAGFCSGEKIYLSAAIESAKSYQPELVLGFFDSG